MFPLTPVGCDSVSDSHCCKHLGRSEACWSWVPPRGFFWWHWACGMLQGTSWRSFSHSSRSALYQCEIINHSNHHSLAEVCVLVFSCFGISLLRMPPHSRACGQISVWGVCWLTEWSPVILDDLILCSLLLSFSLTALPLSSLRFLCLLEAYGWVPFLERFCRPVRISGPRSLPTTIWLSCDKQLMWSLCGNSAPHCWPEAQGSIRWQEPQLSLFGLSG